MQFKLKSRLLVNGFLLLMALPLYAQSTAHYQVNPEVPKSKKVKLSALALKIHKQHAAFRNPLSIILYRPTYILPYYYTKNPYYNIYQGMTPYNQSLMRSEFKAQLSLMVPIFYNLTQTGNDSIDLAYTQLNYWQVYAKSQYFRETNYEPEIFYEKFFKHDWLIRGGIDHQSNGRGGNLERSWNRVIGTLQYSGSDWLANIRLWSLIFTDESANLHNPDIARYLGHENLEFSKKIAQFTFSLSLQNIESGMHRGFFKTTLSYPLNERILLYTQYFNGYGQSLVEYNHRTQAGGIGISFNDWI